MSRREGFQEEQPVGEPNGGRERTSVAGDGLGFGSQSSRVAATSPSKSTTTAPYPKECSLCELANDVKHRPHS